MKMVLPGRFRSFLTAVFALLGVLAHANAVTWDDGAGTNVWSTGANWDTNVEPTIADDVVLAADLGAMLTLSSGEEAKTLTVNDNYTLSGGGLTLAGVVQIGVLLGKTATISTPLTSTGGTIKSGGGTLTLSGSNTLTGGWNIAQGNITVSSGAAAGVGPITFTNVGSDTASFTMSGLNKSATNSFVVAGTGSGDTSIVYAGLNQTSFTLTGGITLGRNLTVDAVQGTTNTDQVGRMIFTGVIDDGAGTFRLVKKGNGELLLTGNNTYGGGTFIEHGTLGVTRDASLGETGVAVTIAGGVLIAKDSFVTSRPITFSSAGSVRVDIGRTLELNGSVTLMSNDIGFFGNGQTILSGTGGGGSGTLFVGANANDFATVSGIFEDIGFNHVLSVRGNFVLPTGSIALDRRAVLELGTGDFTRALGAGPGQVRMETASGGGFAAFGADRVVNLGGVGATLVWGDATTKFLRGPALFTPGEGVGRLVLGSATATHTVNFQNPIEFNNGDTSVSRVITVHDGPAAKEAILSGNLSLNGLPGTTDVSLDLDVEGALEITGQISGAVALFLNGPGSLTLTGANTHTLGNYIDGATLIANSDAALGAAASFVEFDYDATLRAAGPITSNRQFRLTGFHDVIDTNGNNVTLGTGSTLDGVELIKAGAGTLTIAGTQTYDRLTTSAGTTNVNSMLGTGDSIVNANAETNFGADQKLAELNIGANAVVRIGAAPGPLAGVAVVPEPGSLGLLLVGALGFLGWRRRDVQGSLKECGVVQRGGKRRRSAWSMIVGRCRPIRPFHVGHQPTAKASQCLHKNPSKKNVVLLVR